jgi:predicted DsbA family dithiol-disulfide isomerase
VKRNAGFVWLTRLAAAAVAVLVACPPAPALQPTDVAGTINGEPVAVADIDRAAGGIAGEQWRAIAAITQSAARALCTERIHKMLAESEGVDLVTWEARIWDATRPRAAAQATEPSSDTAADHEAHVRAYRQRLASSAQRILDRELSYPTQVDPGAAEPRLADVVAQCLGRSITRADVESYAAYPLYERRAELVTRLCEQFEISYDKPLVVGRVAAAEGKTLGEVLAKIDGDLGEIPEEEVRRAASERYGAIDDMTLLKARLALDEQRRNDRRRAWLEKVRRETQARCTLTMPPPPEGDVRAPGIALGAPGSLPVYYFANFACPNCSSGWQLLRAIASTYAGRARFMLLHHFPESDAELFSQALEAECAAQQGHFEDYGDWRTSPLRLGSAVASIGLDPERLESCTSDPRIAVSVLDDTAEALRLGFREAVPSWVVGGHLRRGIQQQNALERDIDEQLARPAPASGPPPGTVEAAPTRAPASANSAAAGVERSTQESRPSSSTGAAPAAGAIPSAGAPPSGAAREPGGGWR